MRIHCIVTLCLIIGHLSGQNVSKKPIPVFHSHNDYLKNVPLWGALQNGSTSIEIDVFAHNNNLKIAHVGLALKTRQSFKDLYLLPLVNYLDSHQFIYAEHGPLVLMIDFKTNGDVTLPILLNQIEPYKKYFTYYSKGEVFEKELTLVISGKGFDYDSVKNGDSIYVFFDGNIKNCDTKIPFLLLPRGSTNYSSLFKWKGKGKMPENELAILRELIKNASMCNKKLRFYAMPENEKIWATFLTEGVNWINIDNGNKFKDFYWKWQSEK